MDKKILLIALIMGAVAILLGAFGAHGLKKMLTLDQLNTFEVGVRYQIYHALFLLFVANNSLLTLKQKGIVLYLVVIGVILFSGSIYLLSTVSLTALKTKLIGPLTPVGGLLLIASWLYVFYCVFAKK
ncbi:MAG: hypothetical protein CMP76_09195 [Flavobacterium sp.]|uniref:DUF423 domain-containing protein n=1 Tax=Flavobacterium sp. TaxID=239 RepID=UPI000C4473EF|nr:DUF423 domain-containing protein [Flavobacterium sp.]MBF03457.1 hypothetical protein [Flavobacterium sp.]|tara:strand:- start:2633 stop:3016 length:384 start_codon:yes stop_codon:yes gene_type:complete